MTQGEEIKYGNELIAGFMGSEYVNAPYKANKGDKELTDFWAWTKPTGGWPVCAVTGIELSSCYQIANFKYHCCWDWFMGAWFKYIQLSFKLVDERFEHDRHKNSISLAISYSNDGTPYKAFNQLVEGIEWYNKQNNTTCKS